MDHSIQLFSSLKGKWVFNRSIDGLETMRGSAVFHHHVDEDDTYFYREEGVFISGKLAHSSFFREYIYCLRDGMLEVYFCSQKKKQRFFHSLDFISPCQARAIHYCGQDVYQATYNFLKDTWALQYEVKGPQKNFIIETVFKKSSFLKQNSGSLNALLPCACGLDKNTQQESQRG